MTGLPQSQQSDGYPWIEATCLACEDDGKGVYHVEGRCTNCESRYVIRCSRGHDKPGFARPEECPACGCRKVIGGDMIVGDTTAALTGREPS